MGTKMVFDAEGNIIDTIEDDTVVDIDDFVTVVDDTMKAKMAADTAAANLRASIFFRWDKSRDSYPLRIMPGRKSWGGAPFCPCHQHWVTRDTKRVPVPCLAPLGGGCPNCDVAAEARNWLPEQEAQKLESQLSFYYNVIDTSAKLEPGAHPKIQVYAAPKGAHDAIQLALNQGWDILGPNGHPIEIKRTNNNGTIRYTGSPLPHSYKIDISLLGGLHDLPAMSRPPFTMQQALETAARQRTSLKLPPLGSAPQQLPPMQRKLPQKNNKLAGEI